VPYFQAVPAGLTVASQGGIHLGPLSLTLSEITKKGRTDYVQNFPRKAPSSLAVSSIFQNLQANEKQRIHWNRPPSAAHLIPPTLLHPIIGKFVDDCHNHNPTTEDNALVFSLSEKMSGFFETEKDRVSTFQAVLKANGINISGTKIEHTNYTTDGDIQLHGHRYVIFEAKNEMQSGNADVLSQAISYYTHSTSSYVVEKAGFRFPCLLITLAGRFCVLYSNYLR